jgi:hypothetical protein
MMGIQTRVAGIGNYDIKKVEKIVFVVTIK